MKPSPTRGSSRVQVIIALRIILISFVVCCLTGFSAAGSPAPEPPPGMVFIPEGYFPMGRNDGGAADERPLHFVYTDAYYIDKFEVSNAQYQAFTDATGQPDPPFWGDDRFNAPNHPVVGISWTDAMAYARWKGGRLPTEAEWEKAARGIDGRLFPWGGKWDKGFFFYFVNIYGEEDNFRYTAPVDYYESGSSPFGIFNMSGNVWEWCLDWYDKSYYRFSPERNPEGPQPGDMKVLRGGSWINNIDGTEITRRARNVPTARKDIYGFRLVRSVE